MEFTLLTLSRHGKVVSVQNMGRLASDACGVRHFGSTPLTEVWFFFGCFYINIKISNIFRQWTLWPGHTSRFPTRRIYSDPHRVESFHFMMMRGRFVLFFFPFCSTNLSTSHWYFFLFHVEYLKPISMSLVSEVLGDMDLHVDQGRSFIWFDTRHPGSVGSY